VATSAWGRVSDKIKWRTISGFGMIPERKTFVRYMDIAIGSKSKSIFNFQRAKTGSLRLWPF